MYKSGLVIRIFGILLSAFLLFQLYISFHVEDKNVSNLNRTPIEILKIYKKVINAFETQGFLDRSGIYRVINMSQSKKNSPSFDVTYVTQCSWNKMHYLDNILDSWQGPVSVAVFSEGKRIGDVLWRMAMEIYCHRHQKLDLHLIVPGNDRFVPKITADIGRELNETEFCRWSMNFESPRNYNWSIEYPVNLLRNVAKSSCTTDYILVADVDMLPNRDLRKNFLRYVWSRRMYPGKVAFVIPAFEMIAGGSPPQTKSEIISEKQKGNIRPFYFVPCQRCHSLTNYNKWFSHPSLPGTRSLYRVDWKHPWEPFYITHRNVLDFDERFKQYGYNRVSQICQMHVEGYNFLVLDNVFLIHKGFKSQPDFHETKESEMKKNRKLYKKFIAELKVKYPNSMRKCEIS